MLDLHAVCAAGEMLARLALSWELLWSLKRTVCDIIYDLFSSLNQHCPLAVHIAPLQSTLPPCRPVLYLITSSSQTRKSTQAKAQQWNLIRYAKSRNEEMIQFIMKYEWNVRSRGGHPWGAPTRIFILARDRGEDKTRKRISNELRLKTKLTFSSCAICAREKCLRIAAKKVLTRCDIS